jgi:NAD(P)-dependent dehydrogenase (short-subunit alcohol dehydrogenase family)
MFSGRSAVDFCCWRAGCWFAGLAAVVARIDDRTPVYATTLVLFFTSNNASVFMESVDSRVELVDPREMFPKPPFDQQPAIESPGMTDQLTPRPDHGEQSYRGTGKLRGLNALITGGDSGIGRAIAICYAREGANVTINYLSETEDAKQTVDAIGQCDVYGGAIEGDLRDEGFCKSMVQQAVKTMGSLDILINNAAYQETKEAIDEFSSELFDRIFKTNVYAPFWLTREAMQHLPPGGSVINTVSIQGYEPAAYLLPYATTKSALIGMTKGLAKLAIANGVRVNAVAPGPVWTPLIPWSMPAEKVKNFGSNTLFERPAQPIELAPLYVWLASPAASYVTGEVFGCTGGRTPV